MTAKTGRLVRYALVAAFLYSKFVVPVWPETVPGESLIEKAGTVEEVVDELLRESLSPEEIESFLSSSDQVLQWSAHHADRWIEADASERPLEIIRSFEIWEDTGLSASAFIATLAKLMLVREFASHSATAGGLRREIAEMEKIASSGRLDGYVLEMARKEIAEKRKQLEFLQTVAPANQKLYKSMRERIDPVLLRFESIGAE